jgi:mRNA deadenylase 3'-5' endonuclease subunit Ccr4
MGLVEHLISPATLPKPPVVTTPPTVEHLSVVSYNVLLPNSEDGWWTYKMYSPPLPENLQYQSSWEYRCDLLKERLKLIGADVVCLQEVSPKTFEKDFEFMNELGYDGVELFKKGRFRPATFWKKSHCDLASPPVHKDRSLLTSFRLVDRPPNTPVKNWYVLNCHLQAGRQAQRRVRQINEGVRAAMTLARKLKEVNPEESLRLIVCGGKRKFALSWFLPSNSLLTSDYQISMEVRNVALFST